jgi:hypothetical protein
VLFKLDHVDVSCQDLTNQSDRRNLPGWLFGGLRDMQSSLDEGVTERTSRAFPKRDTS